MRLIKRAQRRRDRINALIFAFYLGELIEVDEQIQKIAKKKLSQHYYTAVVRTFYIFEVCPEQIARTRTITLANIRRLTASEYRLVLPEL